MFWIMYSLIILNISVFAFAIIYLYIFRKTHEKYIGYWGLSWVLYGIGILMDILVYQNIPLTYILIAQQMIYSFSIYLLLCGTYAFSNRKFPRKWFYIVLFNVAWGIICLLFNFAYAITVLPLSISFSIISIYTGIIFLQNWEFEGNEKIATGIVFLLWGVHKSYYFYLQPEYSISPTSYITEILLIIALNSCLILTYLQKNRINLIKNEQIFRLLTENSQDLIYLCKYTPEPNFEYVSPNCEKIIGYSQEEFYSNPYLLDDIVHPEDKEFFDLSVNPKLSPKESVTLRYQHKSGQYVWVNEYTTIIYDKYGNHFGIEGIIRDISDKILIDHKIKQTEKERLDLLSNISHELKTPITTIRGYVDAILDNKIPKAESPNKYLINIQSKTHMLELLINDLFELSQFESNQIQFKFFQVPVQALIEDIQNKFSNDIEHAGLIFHVDIDPAIIEKKLEIIADVERLGQAFYNLIYNAIKHTKEGGHISLKCHLSKSDKVIIEVMDTGVGIYEKDLPHVFERFYKGSSNTKKGSGLGLAITKEIINKHFGEIHVKSQLNKGTTFSIILPVSQ